MVMSNSRRRRWRWFGIVVVILICIMITFYAWLDHTIGKPVRIQRQIGDTIALLAKKCPPDMTQDQWNVAVHWTVTLSGNCSLPGGADLEDMQRFQRELEERAKGKVDMDLISWIWDEHAKLYPGGQQYKEKFQKVMLDEMQPSSAERYYWGGDPIFGERHDLIVQIYTTIQSLVSKRPPDLTQDQWNVAVFQTCAFPSGRLLSGRVNLDDLRRFQRELEERAKEKVDMKLVFWIWDEFAKISPAGPQYKQRFQQAMLDAMQPSSAKGKKVGVR
jgi:hypothetical protein